MTQEQPRVCSLKTRHALSVLLLAALPLSAAQTMYVHQRAGTKTPLSMTNLKTLTFTGGMLTVTNRDATAKNFALSSMGYLDFSNLQTVQTPLHLRAGIKTYPNPVRDLLNIELQLTNERSAQLEIIGIDGKVVLHTQLSSPISSISVSALPKGMYLCRVQNGQATETSKFMKW